MDLTNARSRSDLLHFAVRLKPQLEPISILEIASDASGACVTGTLNLSHDDVSTAVSAKCRFQFVPNWSEFVPRVSTSVPWLRRGDPAWHTFRDGSLCFVYGPQWRDETCVVMQQFDIAKAAEFAATWCIRSTRWLLYRHHFGFEHGLEKWPREWPSWQHDGSEHIEYQCLRKANYARSFL